MLKRLSSEKAPKAVGSYSAATKVGNLIYTSGQLPINRETGEIDFPNNIEKQTIQSMENLKYILEENRSSIEKIVKTTVYLQNIEDFSTFNEVYSNYFSKDFPSRTAFEVGNLPMDAMIEIEAIAETEGE